MSQQQAGTTTLVIKDTTPPVRAPQSSPHAITGAAVSTCIKGRTAQGQETKGCARLAAKEIQQNPDNDHPHVGDLGYARCRVHTLRISVSKGIPTTTMMALVSPSCRQLSPRPDMEQTMYCHRTFASHSMKATGLRVSGTFAADVYSTQVPLPQEHMVSGKKRWLVESGSHGLCFVLAILLLYYLFMLATIWVYTDFCMRPSYRPYGQWMTTLASKLANHPSILHPLSTYMLAAKSVRQTYVRAGSRHH